MLSIAYININMNIRKMMLNVFLKEFNSVLKIVCRFFVCLNRCSVCLSWMTWSIVVSAKFIFARSGILVTTMMKLNMF